MKDKKTNNGFTYKDGLVCLNATCSYCHLRLLMPFMEGKFCPQCGERVPKLSELSKRTQSSRKASIKRAKICSKCKHKNWIWNGYCIKCGNELG